MTDRSRAWQLGWRLRGTRRFSEENLPRPTPEAAPPGTLLAEMRETGKKPWMFIR